MAVILSSQLSTLIKQFSAGKLEATVKEMSPIIGSGALTKVPGRGSEHLVHVVTGGSETAQWTSDAAALPVATGQLPAVGRVLPAGLTAIFSIGRMASGLQVGADEATDLFMSEMDRVATSLARHLGRGLYGARDVTVVTAGTFDVITALVGVTNVNPKFADVSIFKPGMTVEFDDISAGKTFVLKVKDVVYETVGGASANVAGSVSFANSIFTTAVQAGQTLTNVDISVGDKFRLAGTSPAAASFGGTTSAVSQAMVSFDDIASQTSDLHGLSVAGTPGWRGNTLDLAGPYSQESIGQFSQRVYNSSGRMFSHAIMNPILAPVHAASGISGTTAFGLTASSGSQKMLNASFDKYGALHNSGLALMGKPVLLDPNCPVDSVYLHNKDIVQLIEWMPLAAEQESGSPRLLSRSSFSYDVQFSGAYNLKCSNRQAFGLVKGITGI